MSRKDLTICGLAMSALLMVCTLLIIGKSEEARAEMSVISSRDTAVLTACSVRYQQSQEILVLVDRTTHMLRAYKYNNRRVEEMKNSPIDLYKAFKNIQAPR